MKTHAHRLNWLKRMLYWLSFHTDVEQALRRRFEDGKRIGSKHAGCPHHDDIPLVETQLGTFVCPLCASQPREPITGPTPRSGVYLARWPGHGPPSGDRDTTMLLPFTDRKLYEWQQQEEEAT